MTSTRVEYTEEEEGPILDIPFEFSTGWREKELATIRILWLRELVSMVQLKEAYNAWALFDDECFGYNLERSVIEAGIWSGYVDYDEDTGEYWDHEMYDKEGFYMRIVREFRNEIGEYVDKCRSEFEDN